VSLSFSKVLVITGGPGVGKDDSGQLHPQDPAREGPSQSRSALLPAVPPKRLSESTGPRGEDDPSLARKPIRGPVAFRRNEEAAARLRSAGRRRGLDGRCPADARLCSAPLPTRAALLLVGDVDQLPPRSGPGRFLADIIASGAVPVVRLTEIFRQACREAAIITNAHRINQGPDGLDLAPVEGGDFFLRRCSGPRGWCAEAAGDRAGTDPESASGLNPIRGRPGCSAR